MTEATQSPLDFTSLARIRRPQGRKGEVFADLLTDFPEKFSERKRLFLLPGTDAKPTQSAAAREVHLAAHWPHKDGIVLHFEGIDSISAAETLNGLIVAIPSSERVALAEDEAYTGDLTGCSLVDLSGAEPVVAGIVEDVDRSAGPVALLVVRSERGEVLVPFAKSYLKKIDIEKRRIEMSLPEGLLELNLKQPKT